VMLPLNTITCSDALVFAQSLPDECVDCVVTSPPYALGLRNYGVDGQWGSEPTPEAYLERMVPLFREVRRVLKPSGVLMLNLGDTYWSNPGGGSGTMTTGNAAAVRAAGRQQRVQPHAYLKQKDLVGIPWMMAFALQRDGWFLRGDYIWFKNNPIPEAVTDRCTKTHEYFFHLTKSGRYYWDQDAIREAQSEGTHARFGKNSTASTRRKMSEPGSGVKANSSFVAATQDMILPNGRNKRSVWITNIEPVADAHFATYPQELIRPAIKAGCPPGGLVYDPFMGSGTTAIVALQEGRCYIGSELNPAYVELARRRIARETGYLALLNTPTAPAELPAPTTPEPPAQPALFSVADVAVAAATGVEVPA
jgi:DNA modification methylase